jgi:hypothetical protein
MTWTDAELQTALGRLKVKGGWVKHTEKINEIHDAVVHVPITLLVMEEILDFHYHYTNVLQWNKLLQNRYKNVSVVLGHTNHGKTQFLFFLVRLLQELDEKVIFLDRTILPDTTTSTKIHSTNLKMFPDKLDYCVQYWSDDIGAYFNDTTVGIALQKNLKKTILYFILINSIHCLNSASITEKKNVWMIIDDVSLLDVSYGNCKFIDLPREEERTPFNFIVTGNVRMGNVDV